MKVQQVKTEWGGRERESINGVREYRVSDIVVLC
jgi:hypothetical protein